MAGKEVRQFESLFKVKTIAPEEVEAGALYIRGTTSSRNSLVKLFFIFFNELLDPRTIGCCHRPQGTHNWRCVEFGVAPLFHMK